MVVDQQLVQSWDKGTTIPRNVDASPKFDSWVLGISRHSDLEMSQVAEAIQVTMTERMAPVTQ